MSERQFWTGLEQQGEDVVRDRLARNEFEARFKTYAENWLRSKAEERALASQSEQIRIARSAKNAAWAAAIAAIIAAIAAIIAFLPHAS